MEGYINPMDSPHIPSPLYHYFPYIGVRGFPYGIFDPWTPWGWGLDGLGKFVRRRRRRRRRPHGGGGPGRPQAFPVTRGLLASNYLTRLRLLDKAEIT